jgi:hypothetical protein
LCVPVTITVSTTAAFTVTPTVAAAISTPTVAATF